MITSSPHCRGQAMGSGTDTNEELLCSNHLTCMCVKSSKVYTTSQKLSMNRRKAQSPSWRKAFSRYGRRHSTIKTHPFPTLFSGVWTSKTQESGKVSCLAQYIELFEEESSIGTSELPSKYFPHINSNNKRARSIPVQINPSATKDDKSTNELFIYSRL